MERSGQLLCFWTHLRCDGWLANAETKTKGEEEEERGKDESGRKTEKAEEGEKVDRNI